MSGRLVRLDMVSSTGTLIGTCEIKMDLFYYERGYRQQIVDRQTIQNDLWIGNFSVRVKELTHQPKGFKHKWLKEVVLSPDMTRGMRKSI